MTAPLHVPPLCSPQRHNPGLGEHVQTERIDSLLIDEDECLPLLLRHRVTVLVQLRVAHELLQFDHLADFGVGKLALRFDQLLSLLGGGIEESRIDLAMRSAQTRTSAITLVGVYIEKTKLTSSRIRATRLASR